MRAALMSSLRSPLSSSIPTTKVCRFGISSAAMAATKLLSSPPLQKDPTGTSGSARSRFFTARMKVS